MNRQKVILNCCELVIDKVQLPEMGYVYFIWKKGKKHTESEKYYADGNLIVIR